MVVRRYGRERMWKGATLLLLLALVLPGTARSFGGQPAAVGERPSRIGDAWASPSAILPTSPDGGAFSISSVWKKDVTGAPRHSNSATMVRALTKQVDDLYSGVAAFNVYDYNTTVYTVPRGQPRVNVAFHDCQNKNHTPKGLTGQGGQFNQVPIPPNAVPSKGRDGQMTVYSPATDQLWEFWKLQRVGSGWQACWGGRIDRVSSSRGYFEDGFGAAATGLAISAGSITLAEARAGRIDHALALAIPDPADWKNYSWPAQRSDGSASSSSPIPEGTRFRLDPSVDVSRLGLTPIAAMIARAAQQYGFIVTDKAGAVSVFAESAQGIVARDGGTNPWKALMKDKPSYSIMANFPWHELEALPRDYGRP